MSWTEERIAVLKKLWNDGLSASQIAAQLGGVTRNAVIGKVHRLGLSGRIKKQAVTQKKQAEKVKKAYSSAAGGSTSSYLGTSGNVAYKKRSTDIDEVDYTNQPEKKSAFNIPAPESLNITITELNEKTCRWPLGDPLDENFRYCGCKSEEALPYCSYHSNIAFQGKRKKVSHN